jgi:hypothetical protein
MRAHLKLALFGPVLLAGLGLANGQGKKDSASANQAEVRLTDGSVVRMTILQESLEIMTKYGKLTVPVTDIRRIDFGFHLPDGVGDKVTQAIKRMGSDIYRQREDAVKELVTLGAFAYPSLNRVARSPDLEVSQRAQAVIKRINENLPEEKLRVQHDDVIQTIEFPITGRIVTQAIQVRSAHFGELSLKLPDLRSIHLRDGSGESEITVDAAKYGSAGDQWMDSSIRADPHLRLVITSHGQVDLWPQGPGQYMTGPKGYSTPGKGGTHMAGSLLGRIGESGKVFVVGDRYEGTPNEDGRIFFHIVPSPWNNSSTGSYRVKVRMDHVALSSGR